MGTRSGDVDPGLLLYLLRRGGYSADALDKLLNHQSGLLGLGGSGDVRELTKSAQAGDASATVALDVFAYRAHKSSAPSRRPSKDLMPSLSRRASASIPLW